MILLALCTLAIALEVTQHSQNTHRISLEGHTRQDASHFCLLTWIPATPSAVQISAKAVCLLPSLSEQGELAADSVERADLRPEEMLWVLISAEIRDKESLEMREILEERHVVCLPPITAALFDDLIETRVCLKAENVDFWTISALESEMSLTSTDGFDYNLSIFMLNSPVYPRRLSDLQRKLPFSSTSLTLSGWFYLSSSSYTHILSIAEGTCTVCNEQFLCGAHCSHISAYATSGKELQICVNSSNCLNLLSITLRNWLYIGVGYEEGEARVCVGRLWKAVVCEALRDEEQITAETIFLGLGAANCIYSVNTQLALGQSLSNEQAELAFMSTESYCLSSCPMLTSSLECPHSSPRKLTNMHVSGFTLWPYMSGFDSHYFAFVNNHISATSIHAYAESHSVYWSCDNGCHYYDIPMEICLYKFWNGSYMVPWCTLGAPASYDLYPSQVANYGGIAGKYMLKVSAKFRYFKYEVKIRIFCDNPSPLCSCSTGNYPSPNTTACLACGASDYYCQSYPMIGCLPYAFDVNTEAYSPTVFSCTTCYASNLVLDQSSGECVSCHPVCASCFGTDVNQCASCYSGASLIGSVGFSSCSCDSGYYPNSTPATCSHCSSTCLTCSGGTKNSCISCKPNATLSASFPAVCRCMDRYGGALDNCQPCDATCETCLLTSSNSCYTCHANAELAGTAPTYCLCQVGYYPNLTSANCSACDASCLTCVLGTASSCTSCYPNKQLQTSPGSCLCPDGFYGDPCSACDPTCLKCSAGGLGDCTACKSNAEIQPPGPSGPCKCMSSYFPSPTVSSCASCHPTCLTCNLSGNTKCLTCKLNASLPSGATEGACSCDVHFFPNPTAALCSPCHQFCSLCVGTSDSQCSTCFSNASLINGANPSKCACNIGYFPSPDVKNCQACHMFCRTCLSSQSTGCTSCYEHATLLSGSCACIAGMFRNSGSSQCQKCHKKCLECHTSSSKCLKCASGDSLTNGDTCPGPSSACYSTCLTCDGVGPAYCLSCLWGVLNSTGGSGFCECPTSSYPSTLTPPCTPCDIHCKSCISGMPNGCTECFLHAVLSDNAVPSSCVCEYMHYFPSTRGDCLQCHLSCATCQDGTQYGCLSCIENMKFSSSSSNTCECLEGYYLAMSCIPCHYTCKTCSNGTDTGCSTCFSNATKSTTGSCECISGYLPSPDVTSCSGCDASCGSCLGPTNSDCTTCALTNTALKNGRSPGQCVCDSGYYFASSATSCQSCDSGCVSCTATGASACTSCHPRAHLQAFPLSACGCDNTFWPLPDVRNCQQCHINCLTCSATDANYCLSCYLHAELEASPGPSTCTCSSGFYPAPIAANCLSCFPSCQQCDGPAEFECTLCYVNASLVGSIPTNCECDQGYYRNIGNASICIQCDSTCAACSTGGANGCTSCHLHAELLASVPSSCKCKNSHFPSTDVLNCVPCHPNCESCKVAGSSNCDTCHLHASLATGPPSLCICDQLYFPDPTVGSCSHCHDTCKACAGRTAQDCTECFAPKEIDGSLLRGPCVDPDSYFPTPPYSPCHPTCQSCLNGAANACLTCYDFALLSGATCICAENSYPSPDSSSCRLCPVTCLTCIGPDSNSCLSCEKSSYLQGPAPNSCLCRPGYFPDPDASLCSPCMLICETCADPVTCSTCRTNAELNSDFICECIMEAIGLPDASNCIFCPYFCQSCFELGCLDCIPGYFFLHYKCYERCPFGYQETESADCAPADMSPPVPTLTVLGNKELSVSFDRPMQFTISSSDFTIDVLTQNDDLIPVTWSEPKFQSSDNFTLSLNFQVSYLPPNSQANFSFISPSKVLSAQLVPIAVSWLIATLNSFGTQANTTLQGTALAKTTAAAVTAVVAVTIVNSLASGGPGSFITLVNQLQLITYLSMTKIPLTREFASTLAAVNVASMLPNPLEKYRNMPAIEGNAAFPPDFIANYGIDTVLFLTNTWSFLAVTALLLLSYLPTHFLSKSSNPAIATYCKTRMKSLTFATPLQAYLTSYLDLCLFSLLQISQPRDFSPYVWASIITAGLFVLLTWVTPIALVAFITLKKAKMRLRNDNLFNERWGVLYDGFAQSDKAALSAYYPLFLVRRLALAVTLVLFSSLTPLLAVLNTSISLLSFLFIFTVHPYAKRFDQIEALTIEAGTVWVYFIVSTFVLPLNSTAESVLNLVGTWSVRAVVAISFLFSLYRSGSAIVKVFREYQMRVKRAKYELYATRGCENTRGGFGGRV